MSTQKRKATIVNYYELSDVIFPDTNNSKNHLEMVTCFICLNVCVDPVMLIRCQHSFCKKCLGDLFSQNESVKVISCPVCKGEFTQLEVTSNRLASEFINFLNVKCLHASCRWVGGYNEFQTHIKECKCLTWCECGKIHDDADKEQHDQECMYAKVNCACGHILQRKDTEKHVKDECEETIILCPYEGYGCTWKGKRTEHNHVKTCKVGNLVKENMKLKKITSTYDIYKNSDCFGVSGFGERDPDHKTLVLKYAASYDILNFPEIFGDTDSNIISIGGVVNDSIFTFSLRDKIDSSNVRIDIDRTQGVMAITLAGRHNRFFIFKSRNAVPKITKSFGKLYIEYPIPQDDGTVHVSPIVFANRRYLKWKDGSSYPFHIEIANRMYSKFFLQPHNAKDLIDRLKLSLEKFFGIVTQ